MLTELERKAWDVRESAAQHRPEMAFKVALDDMAKAPLKRVIHAFAVMVHEDDDGNQFVTFTQAGVLSSFASEGALMRAVRASQEWENE